MSQAEEKKIACTICRRRKTKCDRKEPQCSFCSKNNFDCEYVSNERQPGLRAGYVSQLEERIELLEGRLSNVELSLQRYTPFQNGNRTSQHNEERILESPNFETRMEDASPGFEKHTPSSGRAHQSGTFPNENGATTSTLGMPDIDHGTSPVFHISPDGPSLDFGSQHPHNRDERDTAFPIELPDSVVSELAAIWFERFHPWFAILHQPSWEQRIQSPLLRTSKYWIVVQAIVAVTAEQSLFLIADAHDRRLLQERFISHVILTAIETLSIEAIQALLILSNLTYGSGKLLQSWNLFAICRRIGAHLGLHDLAQRHDSSETSPPGPLRLEISNITTIDQEELIRAYWMIEMLDSISSVGTTFELGLFAAPINPIMPCSDSVWGLPEDVISIHQSLHPSAFSLCIILAVNELSKVHQFKRKRVAMLDFEQRDAWQSEAQLLDERLTMWRDEFVATVFRLINTEYGHIRRGEMDPYIVLTNCVLNTAIITLLERRTSCPKGVEQDTEPWPFANSRCSYAAENTAFKCRQLSEEELLSCHPHLIFSIFVAARFYIVNSKALDSNVPVNLHSLSFCLHTCSKRWLLARTCETVIRTAVAEYRTPVSESKVPRVFYDLRNSALDILGALQTWVASGMDVMSIST